MSGLVPIVWASAHLVLAAERVPEFNAEPNCRAAAAASAIVGTNRDDGACRRDEHEARGKLEQDWGQFTPSQRARCVRLSSLGGAPSYVELLTCLELTKTADELPNKSETDGRASR